MKTDDPIGNIPEEVKAYVDREGVQGLFDGGTAIRGAKIPPSHEARHSEDVLDSTLYLRRYLETKAREGLIEKPSYINNFREDECHSDKKCIECARACSKIKPKILTGQTQPRPYAIAELADDKKEGFGAPTGKAKEKEKEGKSMTKQEVYVCDCCHTKYGTPEECERCERAHRKPLNVQRTWYNAYETFPYRILVELEKGNTAVYNIHPDLCWGPRTWENEEGRNDDRKEDLHL